MPHKLGLPGGTNQSPFPRQCCAAFNRRDLLRFGLLGTGLATGDQSAAGQVEEAIIRNQAQKPVPVGMSVLSVKSSLNPKLVNDFQKLVGKANRVTIRTKKDLREVYKELRMGKTSRVDLVTIGDAWMTSAIRNGYIQPLVDAEKYR